MSETTERETKKCDYCGAIIYKFHSKSKNKDYWCSSNNYMDFHTDKKKTPQIGDNTADKGQSKLDTTSPDFIQVLGKIIINLEERKSIEEKILLVLEQIRDKK